mmetsp:Transcript_2252/g.3444  ORF Transcript_2252/g.3444 Transcript_2252/m.3444 type:complete len:135 (-) Transcript_2252:678-1082(-)
MMIPSTPPPMTKQSFGPAAQYRYPPPLERKRDEASRQYSFKGIVRKLLFRLSDESESKGIDWRNTFSTPSNPAQLMGGDSVISFAQLHPLRPPSPPPLGLGRPRDEASRHYNFRGVVRKLLFRQSDDSECEGSR